LSPSVPHFDGTTWLVSGAAAYCHLSSDEHHHHKTSVWEDATFYEQLVASNVYARIALALLSFILLTLGVCAAPIKLETAGPI
jgi:hypothetical protein